MEWKSLAELHRMVQIGEFPKEEYEEIVIDLMAIDEFIEGIKNTAEFSSWGVMSIEGGTLREMPTAMMSVSGCVHKGLTALSYVRRTDLFRVANIDEEGNEIAIADDVFVGELFGVLDAFIERHPDWTDEEYTRIAYADSEQKGIDMDALERQLKTKN